MKKVLLFAVIAVSLALASCQKSAADYKKEIEKLESEYTELMKEGKTEEAQKVQAKAVEIIGEVMQRAAKDPEFAKECGDLK